MNTALFFRKCSNIDELKYNIEHLENFGQTLEYEIIKTFRLNKNDYDIFVSNFLKDSIIIKKVKDKLFIDNNDKIHCVFITYDNNNGVLVYPAGYDYARYVAFLQK
jgi:hypothetical protein